MPRDPEKERERIAALEAAINATYIDAQGNEWDAVVEGDEWEEDDVWSEVLQDGSLRSRPVRYKFANLRVKFPAVVDDSGKYPKRSNPLFKWEWRPATRVSPKGQERKSFFGTTPYYVLKATEKPVEAEPAAGPTDLGSLNKAQLVALAKAQNLEVPPNISRKDLLEILSA